MPSGKKEKSLKNKYSSFFNKDIPELEPELENSVERIYPSLSELQRNMDNNTIQRLAEDRDQTNHRTRELEGSLGLALQSINYNKKKKWIEGWLV